VTQQNSALVEENAATAKTLEQQSQGMDERVSFFQLGDGAATGASSRVVTMAPRRPAAPAPKRAAAAAAKRGPVGRMQAGLATAFQNDPNSEEF
jgi:methyl-accepting chemotaxis protein